MRLRCRGDRYERICNWPSIGFDLISAIEDTLNIPASPNWPHSSHPLSRRPISSKLPSETPLVSRCRPSAIAAVPRRRRRRPRSTRRRYSGESRQFPPTTHGSFVQRGPTPARPGRARRGPCRGRHRARSSDTASSTLAGGRTHLAPHRPPPRGHDSHARRQHRQVALARRACPSSPDASLEGGGRRRAAALRSPATQTSMSSTGTAPSRFSTHAHL